MNGGLLSCDPLYFSHMGPHFQRFMPISLGPATRPKTSFVVLEESTSGGDEAEKEMADIVFCLPKWWDWRQMNGGLLSCDPLYFSHMGPHFQRFMPISLGPATRPKTSLVVLEESTRCKRVTSTLVREVPINTKTSQLNVCLTMLGAPRQPQTHNALKPRQGKKRGNSPGTCI